MAYFYPQASLTLHVLFEDFQLTSKANLQDVHSFAVMAKKVTVTINDYKTADTFDAEIDYKSFPFDPRAIRALGVSIHMGDVKRIDANPLDALPRTVETTRFLGYADEESIEFNDTERVVKIEGRDLTALLIDRKYTGPVVPLSERLDITIQNLLNQLPETLISKDQKSGLQIELRGVTKAEMPVLARFMKADGDHQLNGNKNVDRNQSYWDLIQDIVVRAGLICFVDLDKLVITKPRVLFNASEARLFIYGLNITNLKMKRKIGRKKNFNVIVRSISGKNVIEAKIPAEATKAWAKAVGINVGEIKIPQIGPKGEPVNPKDWKAAPYVSFLVPDCKDKSHLIEVAQSLYEEVGRQQIEGSFETSDMVTGPPSVLTGKNFDVLQVRCATPIQILIDQGDLRGLSDVRIMQDGKLDLDATVQKRRQFLINRGYPDSVATAFAESLDKFASIYYTKSARFTIDADNGFKAEFEFLNFIDTKLAK